MSYNNNRNLPYGADNTVWANRNANQNFSYQRNNYGGNNNYQGNNQGAQKQQFKKSWAVYSKMRKGKFAGLMAVNAFHQTKFGLQKASCFPVDGVIHTGADKGHDFMRYVVNITNPMLGTTQTYWCLMRMDTQTIVIKELSVCITPNGKGQLKNGKTVSGFFGKNYKSR